MKQIYALSIAVAALIAPSAQASTLYATDLGVSGAVILHSVNQSTGALTTIGDPGNPFRIFNLTSNQSDTIWGILGPTIGNVGPNDLYKFNPATGVATKVATLTGPGITTTNPVSSLAWNPGDGFLYGNTTADTGSAATLYRIDPNTGAATQIGLVGIDEVFGLGFGQDGILYGTDFSGRFLSVSTSTGIASVIGSTGIPFGVFDLASRPEDGKIFVLSNFDQSIYTVDPSTGVATSVGPWGNQILSGLAFLNDTGSGTPEPGTFGLLAFSLPVLLFGFQRRITKKNRPS